MEHMDKFQVYFKSCGSSVLDPIDVEKLKSILERKGASVLADYEASGMLSETSRKLLVKICVSDLIERKGFYPPTDDKSRLARCMVTLFPSLKVIMEDENEGFEHFYDPISHSGFIEMRLRNLRRNLHDDQHRFQRKRSRPTTTNPRASITVEMPIEGEELIVEGIFAEYPRFVDMPYLFDTEFGRILPGKADVFNLKWEATIVPNILKISTASEPSGLPPVPANDASCYKALQKLIQLLPPTSSGRGKGYGKCSVKSALAYLLDIKPGPELISRAAASSSRNYRKKEGLGRARQAEAV
ncbi:unnamed protein product [Arctogadus glacialis]